MNIVLLSVNILVSDQYGTTRNEIVGAFTSERGLEAAKDFANQKYTNEIFTFMQSELEIDRVSA